MLSLTDKVWEILSPAEPPRNSQELLQILASNRGIHDITEFINTSVKTEMPDPFQFVDMEKAVRRIVDAISKKQKIAILGDYDVDGISSVSIFVKFFRELNVECLYYIPNRMEDGYGLSISSIEKYKDCLLIAVDCGSNSTVELAYAKNNGIDVIVIDHHQMSAISPDAVAIVNPHRPDENGDFRYLCATGLVFVCVVGINRELKKMQFYRDMPAPDLISYLDLVALATVCDVVPLIKLNRAFVSTGLKVIKKKKNIGISALMTLISSKNVSAETIGFMLGPRLNAAGRMDSGELSVRLLLSQQHQEAQELATRLNDLNLQRQSVEQEMMSAALEMVDENLNFICVYSPNWHVGVIGIVAGRLKEKYNKLSIIISQDPHGFGKASCRSINGIDISKLIRKAVQLGIIASGGGHEIAAGFSIDVSKIQELNDFLKTEIVGPIPKHKIPVDCVLPLDIINFHTLNEISVLEPFGMKNEYPKFVISQVRIASSKVVAKKHIAVVLQDDAGHELRAIAFKSVDSQLGDLLRRASSKIDVLGSLSISEWLGKRYISLLIEDIANSSVSRI